MFNITKRCCSFKKKLILFKMWAAGEVILKASNRIRRFAQRIIQQRFHNR